MEAPVPRDDPLDGLFGTVQEVELIRAAFLQLPPEQRILVEQDELHNADASRMVFAPIKDVM